MPRGRRRDAGARERERGAREGAEPIASAPRGPRPLHAVPSEETKRGGVPSGRAPGATDAARDAAAKDPAPTSVAPRAASSLDARTAADATATDERGATASDAAVPPPPSPQAPLERLASDYLYVFDLILARLTPTARTFLAASSPDLARAILAARPDESARVIRFRDVFESESTARWALKRCDVTRSRTSAHEGVGRAGPFAPLDRRDPGSDTMLNMLASVPGMFDEHMGRLECANAAAVVGNMRVIRWLDARYDHFGFGIHRMGFSTSEQVAGNKPFLDRPLFNSAAYRAAEHGRVELMGWLLEKKYRYGLRHRETFETLEYEIAKQAAKGGAVECLEWLWENNDASLLKPSAEHMLTAEAAAHGRLEALKWLRDRGVLWNEWTCTRAAAGGHLDVIKYARTHGCPWDENVIRRARVLGKSDVEAWAIENGCPRPSEILNEIHETARYEAWWNRENRHVGDGLALSNEDSFTDTDSERWTPSISADEESLLEEQHIEYYHEDDDYYPKFPY